MLGYVNLAKIVCIYPESDEEAVRLAEELIVLLSQFKGPDIPTDIHLGAILYTRYGSFNPIIKTDAEGNQQKHIYNQEGQLVPDEYAIPFMLPKGIAWPFESIRKFNVPSQTGYLNDRIKIMSVLKPDVKGRVIKGMYMKSWFQAKKCIVKEGRKNMCSDLKGRDIRDRLEWQLKLHNDLCNDVPIPKIIDCFRENDDLYLAMEFIDGVSLDERIRSIYDGHSWMELPLSSRLTLLDHLTDVVKVIQQLHQKQYIHRDIAPENFIIDKKGKLYVIDLELTYSGRLKYPLPSFGIGTYGFFAPEQLNMETPATTEDIYELGALMIVFFTCLSPLKFELNALDRLREDLYFFIGDDLIATLITDCLNPVPEQRPPLFAISAAVSKYRSRLLQLSGEPALYIEFGTSKDVLKPVIMEGLAALTSGLMSAENGVWISRTQQINQNIGNPQASCSIYPGLYEGVSGVLYMLSGIKQSGIELNNHVQQYYQHNLEYLRKRYSKDITNIPAGLYTGSAGIAMMVASGIQCGLIRKDEENTSWMQSCLDREPAGYDLVNGAAGQGRAIIQCMPYLPEAFANNKLGEITSLLYIHQDKNGAWAACIPGERRNVIMSGLSQGVGGIAYFLLHVAEHFNDNQARSSAANALGWLQKNAHKKDKAYIWCTDTITREMDLWVHNGIAGIALVFIRAFEVLQDPVYQRMAEGALANYPDYITHRNHSYTWGISGLGEVYLEAWRVFKDDKWKQRADWIAGSLIHLKKRHEQGCYWLADAMDIFPTADLMTGNSGIINFLVRNEKPGGFGYLF
nr:lanthionine synthetase LanC family protein [Chitinophaga rupis]